MESMSAAQSLYSTFMTLARSAHKDIPGVIKIDSTTPGPTVGITVCTHGNEPCGLAAADFVLKEVQGTGLLKGTLYIVLNNEKGTRLYFQSLFADTKRQGRFIDINMNRLPHDLHDPAFPNAYECERARELLPIWETFDYALDIHSTTQDAGSMLVGVHNGFPLELTRGFDVEMYISNIANIQIGTPAASLYGVPNSRALACGIECGAHEDPNTFNRAIGCAKAFLQNLGMIAGHAAIVQPTYDEYRVVGSVMFPNLSYSLQRQFRNFEFLSAGTVFANGNRGPIVADYDCHSLFAGKTSFESLSEIQEEVLFISLPVHKISLI